ncbi:MAG: hypothetical protein ACPG8W_05460 [Candidatus Promineifilaceae bacterium]
MIQDRKRGWMILLLVWAGVLLACNLPLSPRAQPLVPPTLPAESAEVPVDEEAGETGSAENTNTPSPTTTLLPQSGSSNSGTIELAPTVTPRATPGGPDSATEGEDRPLALEYEITWELNEENTAYAFATVNLSATGGDGEYSYFRDDRSTSGSQFVYRWGSCKANPGSFRVDSGDGQSVRVKYFEEAPCP